MRSEAWWRVVFLALSVVLVVGSIGYCSKVSDDCAKAHGVVVKNYYDLPTCIDKGKHP